MPTLPSYRPFLPVLRVIIACLSALLVQACAGERAAPCADCLLLQGVTVIDGRGAPAMHRADSERVLRTLLAFGITTCATPAPSNTCSSTAG